MGKDKELERSDDIEIIAIGNLYTGPWDKKYWSSSRGKDRYPYPVGYKSIRNQNGISYKMEIIQGPKGPSFTISSTDGKSCSGETPDIAWESFQKKGCSRIKLGHVKRFSCKIDGVEFFGFKNAFVQRLLRELVANVRGTAEQSLLNPSISSRDCETVYQLNGKESVENHDLVPYSVKSLFTRKRSRNDKVVNKRVNQIHFEQNRREKYTRKATASNSWKTDKLACSGGKCAAANEISGFCSSTEILGEEKSPTTIENETCPSIAERVGQLDSMEMPDYLTIETSPFSQGKIDLISSRNNLECGTDKMLKNQEPINGPRTAVVQEFSNSTPEEKDGGTNVQYSMTLVKDVDICVPDTLDHLGDSSPLPSSIDHAQFPWNVKEEMITDVAKSEVWMTDSLPEEEIGVSNSSSEKCDTDSVGEDIAKSMMTVLLPRALPLLKAFTRKRKKSAKPLKMAPPRLLDENDVSNSCIADAVIGRGKTIHSNLDRQKENTCAAGICNDLLVSTFGNTELMVPGTFDNVDCHDVLSDAAKAGPLINVLDTQTQLQVHKEADIPICHGGIKGHELNLHCEIQPDSDAILPPQLEISANSRRSSAACHTTDKLHALPLSTVKRTPGSESIICKSLSDVDPLEIPTTGCCCSEIESNEMKESNIKQLDRNGKLPGLLELFACYIQPMPISMVQLIVKENDIYVCVKCGSLENKESTLFVYKTIKNGKKLGYPLFIGHVPVACQLSKNALGGDVALESSLIQFTPDAQALVLLNSIKTPYCREGKLNCLCAVCASDCVENAVKIVQLNSGYVSLVAKLETIQDVCCLLVCEPSFLLAAEEGGKLKLWLMNSTWSAQNENWYLPTFYCMFPCLVELKRIPNSATLVIGHNGFGEFGIWNIVNRNLVSKFSSPGMSILKCVPAGIFMWQRKLESTTEKIINEIMDATKQWFSETVRRENHESPAEDKDVAVWLLISIIDQDSQHCQSSVQHANLLGYWRLALLINNTVITGSAIGPGAAAVTSSGYGIIGSMDGLVYEWELSTGVKLGTLHSFKGAPVSCIATDESNSGALAIASGCQLLVYLPS